MNLIEIVQKIFSLDSILMFIYKLKINQYSGFAFLINLKILFELQK